MEENWKKWNTCDMKARETLGEGSGQQGGDGG